MFNILYYFSFWIFIWFIFYYYKLTTYNPLFALYCAFFIGYILFIIPMLLNCVSLQYIVWFTLISIIIKLIPIYYLHKNNKILEIKDIQFTIILFLIYLFYIYTKKIIFYKYYRDTLYFLMQQDKLKIPFFDMYKYFTL